MERKKIYYGWFVVFGCLMITCTMVPPIMALSNKFLIQVTGELQISRSAFTLANTILQGLGIFLSPCCVGQACKRQHETDSDRQHYRLCPFLRFLLPCHQCDSSIHFLLLYRYFLFKRFPDSGEHDDYQLVCQKRGLAMSIAMAGIGVAVPSSAL